MLMFSLFIASLTQSLQWHPVTSDPDGKRFQCEGKWSQYTPQTVLAFNSLSLYQVFHLLLFYGWPVLDGDLPVQNEERFAHILIILPLQKLLTEPHIEAAVILCLQITAFWTNGIHLWKSPLILFLYRLFRSFFWYQSKETEMKNEGSSQDSGTHVPYPFLKEVIIILLHCYQH